MKKEILGAIHRFPFRMTGVGSGQPLSLESPVTSDRTGSETHFSDTALGTPDSATLQISGCC